ncbi:MAG: ImmA/IrrE family metallo-endopeptidase, partial [Planctomycetota bacterium]|nr:ImmA/IrrE family metallo-endopeptidase [Planctomycetota bacterium]
MLAEITAEELYAELDAVAAEVLAEVGVEGPPVDAFAVADALRIAVALDDHQQGRARYVRLRAFRGSRPMRAKPKTQQNLQTSAHRARKLQSETLRPSMPTTQQNLQTSAHRVQKLQSETLKPSILLRPDPRAERRQWAVAHEIGEHVAWRVFGRLGVDPREAGPDSRESVANQLAGRLLLPGEWFEADAVACGWD